MREYNLFIIRKSYYDLYQNKPYILFDLLENLSKTKKTNFSFGITIFKELCIFFDKNILNDYLNKKYSLKCKDYFIINGVSIKLNKTRIIVRSKYNLPNIIKMFNYYNKYLFVCDFENKDFFWLNDFSKNKLFEYMW